MFAFVSCQFKLGFKIKDTGKPSHLGIQGGAFLCLAAGSKAPNETHPDC